MKNLQEVRESIINAAEKYFSLLGFEKTTLDSISGEDGKCKTSIYYHFKNKHDIFKSVIDREFRNVKTELSKILDNNNTDNRTQLKNYLLCRLDVIQKQGAYRRFASSRFAYGDNAISRTVRSARSDFDRWERNYFEENIKQGISDGSIPPGISPEVFASTLSNIIDALEIKMFSTDYDKETVKTYKELINLIIR